MLVCRDQDKLQKRCPGNSCFRGIFLGEFGFPSDSEAKKLGEAPKQTLDCQASPGNKSSQAELVEPEGHHRVEKFRNKKGSFLDQYVVDSSENLRAAF